MTYDWLEFKNENSNFQFVGIEKLLNDIASELSLLESLEKSLDTEKREKKDCSLTENLIEDCLDRQEGLKKELENKLKEVNADDFGLLKEYLSVRNEHWDEGAKAGNKELSKDDCAWQASATRLTQKALEKVIEEQPSNYDHESLWPEGSDTINQNHRFAKLEELVNGISSSETFIRTIYAPISRDDYFRNTENANEEDYLTELNNREDYRVNEEQLVIEKQDELKEYLKGLSQKELEAAKNFLETRKTYWEGKRKELTPEDKLYNIDMTWQAGTSSYARSYVTSLLERNKKQEVNHNK